jgi:hypothetical protein
VDTDWLADTRTSYDTVAPSYTELLRGAVPAEPYLWAALSLFAGQVRALRPGGPLLAGFHVGDVTRLKTEGYGGHPMRVRVHRRTPERMAALLRDAGFTVGAHLLLDPDTPRPGALLFAS